MSERTSARLITLGSSVIWLALAACGAERSDEGSVQEAASVAGAPSPTAVGGLGDLRHAARPIKDRYIVVLTDAVANVPSTVSTFEQQHSFTARHTYTAALKGFAAAMPEAKAIALSNHPLVAW